MEYFRIWKLCLFELYRLEYNKYSFSYCLVSTGI